jgi:hypothetical protein
MKTMELPKKEEWLRMYKSTILIIILILSGCSDSEKQSGDKQLLVMQNQFSLKEEISELFLAFNIDDRLLLIDECNSYIYDFNGELHSEFGGKGYGPGELQRPLYGFFDYNKNQISIADIGSLKLHNYSMESEYVNSDIMDGFLIFQKNYEDFFVRNVRHLGDNMVTDTIELSTEDTLDIIYQKEYKSTEDIISSRLLCDTNGKSIYVLDIDKNAYTLISYDLNGKEIFRKNGKKDDTTFLQIYAGDDFSLLGIRKNESFIYEILSNNGDELGEFEFNLSKRYVILIDGNRIICKSIGEIMKIEVYELMFNKQKQ